MANRWANHWVLRNIGAEATAIARSWGSEQPGPLDLLQSLADSRRAAGAALAAEGLTEQSIVRWRRARIGGPVYPLFAVHSVKVLGDLDRLLQRICDSPRPLLNKNIGLSRVGAALLSDTTIHDPELSALLVDFRIDHQHLSVRLAEAASARLWLSHPGATIIERLGTIVFEPSETTSDVPRRPMPERATWVNTDASTAAIGQHLLASLADAADTAAANATPYWERLGHQSHAAFLRRSRLVMASQHDYTLALTSTRHSGRLNFEVLIDSTDIRVPVDDPSAIGNAALAAISQSMG